MDKNFIITDENDNFEQIEEKVCEFITTTFKKEDISDIEFNVDFGEYDYGNTIIGELRIEITFNKYKYKNNKNEEKTERIVIILEDKYLQPFYIDGKFVSKNVYEWTSGILIQKTKKIYGYDKDKL